jgi:hypothetical protein
MGIRDFFSRREPTPEQERRLAQLSSPNQKKAILKAIRAGKAIPDSAWSPLPAGTDVARLIDRESAQATEPVRSGDGISGGTSEESTFHLWADPKETSFDDIGKDEGPKTLFGWGVVNPFSPTLTVVATDGVLYVPGRKLPIVYLVFNPFQQEASIIGEARIGRTSSAVRDQELLFGVRIGGCPTLLLPSAFREPAEDLEVYADFLTRFDDGSRVLEKVRRFPGDPWKRVQADVDESFDIMARGMKEGEAKRQIATGRRLTGEEACELASHLLEPKNVRAELDAFMYAWQGSIKLQKSQGAAFLAKEALSMDKFVKQFLLLALSCRLPEREA